MKNAFIVLGLLALSSASMAESMNCKFEAYRAGVGGLLPGEKFEVTIPQEAKVYKLKACTTQESGDLILMVCADPNDLVGGYTVDWTAKTKGTEDRNYSIAYYQTLRTGKIVQSSIETETMESYRKNMYDADIDTPYQLLAGDSDPVDRAVSKAVKQGALKVGAPVVVALDECKLTK